jgi:hypothetical protein
MTTDNHENGDTPPYDNTLPEEVAEKLNPTPDPFSAETGLRLTSLEEALVAKREAHKEYEIQGMQTPEGTLYRIHSKEGQAVSPLFFSWNCMQTFLQRMPLLSSEEWESHPAKDYEGKPILCEGPNETH